MNATNSLVQSNVSNSTRVGCIHWLHIMYMYPHNFETNRGVMMKTTVHNKYSVLTVPSGMCFTFAVFHNVLLDAAGPPVIFCNIKIGNI